MVFGWWGIISFFTTWFYLINNTITYLVAQVRLRQESAHRQRKKQHDPEATRKALRSFEVNIKRRLLAGDEVEDISRDVSEVTEVSLRQVRIHVAAKKRELTETVNE